MNVGISLLSGWMEKRFHGQEHMYRKLSASTGYFIGQAYIFSPEEAADYLQPEFDCGLSIADILNPLFDKMEDKDIDAKVAKKLNILTFAPFHAWRYLLKGR